MMLSEASPFSSKISLTREESLSLLRQDFSFFIPVSALERTSPCKSSDDSRMKLIPPINDLPPESKTGIGGHRVNSTVATEGQLLRWLPFSCPGTQRGNES
jgi:hypothetical protein